MEKRKLPKFEDEAQETRWWYENREELAHDFVNASREGRTGPGAIERLRIKRAEAVASQAAPEKSSQAA